MGTRDLQVGNPFGAEQLKLGPQMQGFMLGWDRQSARDTACLNPWPMLSFSMQLSVAL